MRMYSRNWANVGMSSGLGGILSLLGGGAVSLLPKIKLIMYMTARNKVYHLTFPNCFGQCLSKLESGENLQCTGCIVPDQDHPDPFKITWIRNTVGKCWKILQKFLFAVLICTVKKLFVTVFKINVNFTSDKMSDNLQQSFANPTKNSCFQNFVDFCKYCPVSSDIVQCLVSKKQDHELLKG